jgi:hypothetical protein
MCMKFIKENIAFKVEVNMANQQDLDNLSKKKLQTYMKKSYLGVKPFFEFLTHIYSYKGTQYNCIDVVSSS